MNELQTNKFNEYFGSQGIYLSIIYLSILSIYLHLSLLSLSLLSLSLYNSFYQFAGAVGFALSFASAFNSALFRCLSEWTQAVLQAYGAGGFFPIT